LSFLAATAEDLRTWTAGNGDLLTCEGRRGQPDWLRQRLEMRYRYERWRDGALVESQIDLMAQRYWGLEEFHLALRQTGFTDVRVTGNYDRRRAPRAGDRTLTYEARRA
jgi:hypothetical protein